MVLVWVANVVSVVVAKSLVVQDEALGVHSKAFDSYNDARFWLDCLPSARVRQIEGFCGGRISGSS
jgi:hypothetical protein